MTQQEKRIKIIETLGYERCQNKAWEAMVGERWLPPWAKEARNCNDNWLKESMLPDFFSDLNACMKFKDFLRGEQIIDFLNWLYFLAFIPNSVDRDYGIAFAEPKHYCEAFGLTLKLWKEGE